MNNSTAIAEYKLDEREINIFKKNFAPKATPDEWELFLFICAAYGLSPLKKQIYLVSRWDTESGRLKATPQISIDGLRLLAQRTKEYEGQVGPFWCDDDGKWVDVWLKRDAMPRAAVVGVWRKNFRQPLFKVVNFEAVAGRKKGGELNSFWQKMGPHMLAKCAEAASLRAAFPEVDGLYIHEEMNQADIEASMITVIPEPAGDPEAPETLASKNEADPVRDGTITNAQIKSIRNLCNLLGKEEPTGLDDCSNEYAKEVIATLGKELSGKRQRERTA